MSGYCYGEPEPVEECGCCGGRAHAEFCDVGVGMVQVSPFHCGACGAMESVPDGKGGWKHGWHLPQQPSERGERVTGYLVNERGHVFETTFDFGHEELCAVLKASQSALLGRGCVRITSLEGFAVDLPPAMSDATRRALLRTLKRACDEDRWGMPYVKHARQRHGEHMALPEIMAVVSSLPRPSIPERTADGDSGPNAFSA